MIRKFLATTSALALITAYTLYPQQAEASDNQAFDNNSVVFQDAKPVKQDADDEATQEDEDVSEKENDDKDEAKKDKSFEETIEGHDVHEGLFTLYRDPKTGDVHMAIAKDRLDKEYIYFTQTLDGVLEAGHFRGNFRDNAVFSIRRHFDRIEFVAQNTGFYFDPDAPLARASEANISPAVLGVAKIAATSTDGETLLVKANKLFLSEAFHQVSPSPRPDEKKDRFKLGKLSTEKSKITALLNYPQNTDVVVDYVYENPAPVNRGSDAITDARAVTITMRHTLIEMPENGYIPRFDDPRVGYFTQKVTDMTSLDTTPYRDLVNRWSLVKKDATAALSDPVEPITFWIENTTPLEYRDTIRDAVLAWNEAYESAGFTNAVVVKVQPDDAEWDAGDIRYNVLRWTSSPTPPFGGYGPSFVNPRTGQILGADIMLEHSFVSNRLRYEQIYETAGTMMAENPLELSGEEAVASGLFCTLGHHLQVNTMFGSAVLAAAGFPQPEKHRLIKEALYYLALHEVGHTLGLNHNMKASQLHDIAGVMDKDKTTAIGLTGSVMDYPAVNIADSDKKQVQYYTTKPGPYDHWAIEFGYSPDVDDEATREALLARSTEPQLAFGNDADDMRAPGKAIDPRVMIGDMSSDAIGYAENQITLAQKTVYKLKDKLASPGQSWHEVRTAYLVLTGQQQSAASIISRYIGGVYVDRAFVGQDTQADAPFIPVSLKDQKRAMAALSQHVFAPDAFDVPDDLLSHLQMQRRGFEFFTETEDPKIHQRILKIQDSVLEHLLHNRVMTRITDSGLYGNQYDLATMMADLTDAIFKDDLKSDVNSRRQNLQIAYVTRLGKIMGEKKSKDYDPVSRSVVLSTLQQIDGMMKDARRGDAMTRAHRAHVSYLIEQALYPGRKA